MDDESRPPSPPPPPPDPATDDGSPLGHIVDDETPRAEAIDWAVEQLYEDRPFEDLEAALLAAGWSDDATAEVVEEARQRTRRHRGATTRDQVVMNADRMYRRATGRWYVGMPMLAAAWRLLHSVATLLALRAARRGDRRKT